MPNQTATVYGVAGASALAQHHTLAQGFLADPEAKGPPPAPFTTSLRAPRAWTFMPYARLPLIFGGVGALILAVLWRMSESSSAGQPLFAYILWIAYSSPPLLIVTAPAALTVSFLWALIAYSSHSTRRAEHRRAYDEAQAFPALTAAYAAYMIWFAQQTEFIVYARDLLDRDPGSKYLSECLPWETTRWQVGASGEARVGKELAKLPGTFTVFHDAAVAGSNANVDHVVVGPQGLIIVDTKVRGGRITFDGGTVIADGAVPDINPFDTLDFEAASVELAVGVPYTATIMVFPDSVLVDPHIRQVFDRPRPTFVVGVRHLAEALTVGLPGISAHSTVAVNETTQRMLGGFLPAV